MVLYHILSTHISILFFYVGIAGYPLVVLGEHTVLGSAGGGAFGWQHRHLSQASYVVCGLPLLSLCQPLLYSNLGIINQADILYPKLRSIDRDERG